jgi:hypothetical protein
MENNHSADLASSVFIKSYAPTNQRILWKVFQSYYFDLNPSPISNINLSLIAGQCERSRNGPHDQ